MSILTSINRCCDCIEDEWMANLHLTASRASRKDAPNLSPAVITRLTAEWQADYDAAEARPFSAAIRVRVGRRGLPAGRMEEAAECMLVLIGATPEGKKELVGFQTGVRESAQSWRELLVDIKQRGLEIAPDLAVGDGALGFWKAIEEVFPGTRHQRCWVHKTANVLNKVASRFRSI